MPYVSRAQEKYFNVNKKRLERKGVDVDEWNAANKGMKLPARKSKKKPKFVINNKMKAYGRMDTKTNVVEINKRKHHGSKRELADTIKHELIHVKHPQMHEKTVYKKTAPELSHKEQEKLIAKLRMRKLNYKAGAAKRKLKIHKGEKVEPGTLISKMNSQKVARNKDKMNSPSLRTSFMGMV